MSLNYPLTISYQGLKEEPEVDSLIHKEAGKLGDCSDRIEGCRVVLETLPGESASSGYRVTLRIRVQSGTDLVISHEACLRGFFRWKRGGSDRAAGQKDLERTIKTAFSEARRRVEDYHRTRKEISTDPGARSGAMNGSVIPPRPGGRQFPS